MFQKRMQQFGLTPAKAVLIGVLVIIFVAVVASNFVGDEDGTTAPKATAKRRKGSATVSRKVKREVPAKTTALNSEADAEVRKWPDIKLSQAIAHDPFALPVPLRPTLTETVAEKTNQVSSEFDEAAEEQRRLFELRELRKRKLEKIRTMQETGVAIVLVTPEESVVKIGNRKLHVGDYWEGFRITEIRPDGSVVVDID